MSQFLTILIWLAFVAYLANRRSIKKIELVDGEEVLRFRFWFALVVFCPLIWMAANRTLWFGDTAAYVTKFYLMPSNILRIPAYLVHISKDKGFTAISIIIKAIVGADHVAYFMVLAAIQGYFLISVYRKYSIDYILSIALFVLSTDYIGWMFNGIRQFLAVTVVFGATSLMLKKKSLWLFVIIWIASTFHQSALLMILFVIIAQGKAWNRRTMFFIAMSILAVLFIGEFTTLLDSTLQETQYANVVSDYVALEDDGTNPLRVLIYSVPTILAFVGRKRIRTSENKLIHFCTNMSLISTGLYLVSMFTSGVFLGRLPIYCSLYNYILLPWEIHMFFEKRSRKLMLMALIACYFGFYFFQMHFQWGFI